MLWPEPHRISCARCGDGIALVSRCGGCCLEVSDSEEGKSRFGICWRHPCLLARGIPAGARGTSQPARGLVPSHGASPMTVFFCTATNAIVLPRGQTRLRSLGSELRLLPLIHKSC